MKSRPAQYAGLVLLMLASFAVIFLPVAPKPQPQKYVVELTAPKKLQELVGSTKIVADEADEALASEFKTNEALPQKLELGDDGVSASLVDTASDQDEARARAARIVKALDTRFKGIKLASDFETRLSVLPTKPLLPLGRMAVYPPQTRNGSLVPAVKLGLDLQGGVDLVLQMRRALFSYNVEGVTAGGRDAALNHVRSALDQTPENLGLRNADVSFSPDAPSQIQIRTQATDEAQFKAQTDAVAATLKNIKGLTFTQSSKPQFYGNKGQAAGPGGGTSSTEVLNSTVEILRSRVDNLGVSEPIIQAAGSDRILVQLPGLKDPERAVETIGKTAQMRIVLLPTSLHTVGDPNDPNNVLFQDAKTGELVPNDTALSRCLDESANVLAQLLPGEPVDADMGIVSGADVVPKTTAGFTEGGGSAIFFELQGVGSRRFAAVTREVAGKGRQIPIFLDQKCISAPNVQSPITQGRGQITMGDAPLKEAQDLAVLLNSGALPAPIDVVQNRTVSATLGNDSLVKSIRAGMIGIAAVAVFMIVFYRLPGFLANFALAVYCVLNLAAFILVGGTLTLPGIAGFLLAVAMSLDTNILVFERLREEMAIQPTFAAALRAAFSRAWTAILDSHVTTLVAALVLFYFGTGPVKGFALTLGIGVLISLFSAISVTRLLLWSVAGLGEKNPSLFAGKLPDKELMMAQHGK